MNELLFLKEWCYENWQLAPWRQFAHFFSCISNFKNAPWITESMRRRREKHEEKQKKERADDGKEKNQNKNSKYKQK